jgi:hypothetical protein
MLVASRPSGEWNDDYFDVLAEEGAIGGPDHACGRSAGAPEHALWQTEAATKIASPTELNS